MARVKVYHKRGGAELVVSDGGKITVESGGTIEAAAGSTITGLDGAATFASDAEAITGTLTTKVLCPKNLAAAATTHVAAASATVAGKVELATDAETQTGTDATRAVTPASLAATTATATRAGVVELATAAEALAGSDTARAVTPAGLQGSIANVELISFSGAAATGPCTATGLKAGDLVLSVTGIAAGTVGDQIAKFEATISVNDQIQQSDNGNLSANIYLALVHRKS
jgi:hypothetical protein